MGKSTFLSVVVIVLFVLLSSTANAASVFAHFMVGNTYNYQQSNFQADFTAAKAVGIDAFALNVGSDSWTYSKVDMAYAAANVVGFKLCLSFDMNYYTSPSVIAGKIAAYANNGAQFKYNGKAFVSTFGGDFVSLGAATANAGWQVVRSTLSSQGISIYFVPNWSGQDANTVFDNNPVMDGVFSWVAWVGPTDTYDALTSSDNIYTTKAHAVGKTYLAPVSPWFYAHVQNWNKNYLYKTELGYITRWEQILTNKPDFVEIITWNDWGESHYIGPLDTNQADIPSGAGPYVNSFPHDAWRAILPYYIQAYKANGTRPTIATDVVVIWYRPHPAAATATADSYGRPGVANRDTSISSYTPAQVLADQIFVVALLKQAGTITINSGSSTPVVFQAPAGKSTYSTNFATGTQKVALTRNGAAVCSHTGAVSVVSSPSTYNYNVYVGQCA